MTNPNQSRGQIGNYLSAAVRWGVGGMFLYMGLSKAMDPAGFLKLVHQYDLVRNPLLLNAISAALPWFEAFCGLLLLAGIAVRGTALMLVTMLVPFTAVVLHHALQLQADNGLPFCAIKFDCGCGTGEVFICRKLTENTLLVVAAIWLTLRRHHAFCLWSPAAARSR